MRSVSDDDVRKRLLEKPRLELAAKGVFRMNAEQRQTAALTDLSRRSACRQHVTTSTVAIYCYSARKLILILPSPQTVDG